MLATIKALNSTKIPREQKNNLREILSKCSSIAAEPTHRCACSVENLRTKTTCSSGARSGRLFVMKTCTKQSRSLGKATMHLEVWNLPRGPRRSCLCLSIGCKTLPESVLADARFVSKTQSNESVVAWIDGACACNQDARFRMAGCGIFSVRVMTGIALSLCLGVSKPRTMRSFWRQVRCECKTETLMSGHFSSMSCVLLLEQRRQCGMSV